MKTSGNSWSPVIALLLVGIILAASDLFVPAVSVVLLLLAGVLFGILLGGLSRLVTRSVPLSYRSSYALVVVALVATVALGAYLSGTRVSQQTAQLTQQLSSTTQQLAARLEKSGWASEYLPDPAELQRMITQRGGWIASGARLAARWFTWGLTGVIVIFFVGLYVAYDPALYEEGVIRLVPPDRRRRASEVMRRINSTLGWWIVGRLISMSIVGIVTAVALWLLGVPLPWTLGVLAALLTFVPNIGPVLAAIPQILLAFQVGPATALYVLLFNIVLQGVESYAITPIVQRYEVSLPPALTIAAQLLMAVLFGVAGVIMAAPLCAVSMVLLEMLYIHDKLGDRVPGRLAG